MSELFDRVERALLDTYAIERELGAGGMATVFLAEDLKHGRMVALKVFRPELATILGADRFLREIKVTANLQHPNILPLYDTGQADGLLYYVMPFVEGETLADRLRQERQLPIDEAVRIACEIGEALHYAHERSLVHRDVKPENILLSAGHPVVADFGIARAVGAAGGERMTETGVSLGTPSYMSPEQVAGDESLDRRSDIYALGCVLYEMLTGHPPFTGPNPQAIMARQAVEPVPGIRVVRDTVSEALERVIFRALAKVPADRFQTAQDFVDALRAPVTNGTRATATTGNGHESIAVLPFANMSADPDNEYFCDGMTEEIINALTRIKALRVAARTSTFVYKGKPVGVRQVGQDLNVSTVLEGSVRKAGERLRITVELVNVQDGYHLWSERFDRRSGDVFAIQEEIANSIVDSLQVRFGDEPIVKPGTGNLDAYHLYLKGRHFWYNRQLPNAIGAFEKAIEIDPEYALAYAGLADAYVILGLYGYIPSRQALTRARAAAERAVAADPDLAEGHYSIGLVEFIFGWKLEFAEAELRRAIELKPSLAAAHATLAQLLGCLGHVEETLEVGRHAQRLEPVAPLIHATAAFGYVFAREIDAAIEACITALEIEAHALPALWVLGIAYTEAGRYEQAVDVLEKAVTFSNRSSVMLMHLGAALVRMGRHEEANDIHRELTQRARTTYVPPAARGWIPLYRGEFDTAMEQLAHGFDEHDNKTLFVAVFPELLPYRNRPEFLTRLRAAGMEALGAAFAAASG